MKQELAEHGSPARPRAANKRLRIVAGVAWSLALLVGGTAAAWELFHRTVDPAAPDMKIELAEDATSGPTTLRDNVMPDVGGLTEAEARQAVLDAGVAPESISVTATPHAGEPGRVVSQDPLGGSSNPEKVVLTLATAATVPEATNRLAADVVAELAGLGVSVRQVPRYRSGATPGTVVGINPPAGSPLPPNVELTVTTEAGQLYLDALAARSNRCSTGKPITVSGTQSVHALVCSTSRSSTRQTTYDLVAAGGTPSVERFEATVAQTEDSEPGRRVRLEVVADVTVCGTAEIEFGKTTKVACNLTGASTLALSISAVTDGDGGAVRLAILDPVLFGDPAGLDALVEASG